jgi:hypothetical protein
VEGIVGTFEADGYVREPRGGEYLHRGADELRHFYAALFGRSSGILSVNKSRKSVWPVVLEYRSIEILVSVSYRVPCDTTLIPMHIWRGGEDYR